MYNKPMITTRIESFAKYAGIATVSVEWLALLLYYIQMPSYFGGQYPISHFASLPETKLIFTICYVLAGTFFWIFLRHHIHNYYRVPIKLFTWSMILFVGLAITPYDPHNSVSNTIHVLLAQSSAILFVVGMYKLAKHANNKPVTYGTFIAILASLGLLIAFLMSPKESPLIFALEAGSWFVWQIWVLWISYYSFKNNL